MGNRIMISQPMYGLSEEEILNKRDKIANKLRSLGFDVIDTYFDNFNNVTENVKSIPLYYLAKSLKMMSTCDAVFFCKGWETARGCKIEYDAANAYHLTIIHEDGGVVNV